MISIVDIGISNTGSVGNALRRLGYRYSLVRTPAELAEASVLILPGVGSFARGAARLRETGLAAALRVQVLERKTPILGICLGMQLLARSGTEGGESEGLGLIDATVVRLPDSGLRLPHVGWNQVMPNGAPYFENVALPAYCYFVHSYHMIVHDNSIIATSEYGIEFCAGVFRDQVAGTQFHPEKSQAVGLQLLRNFLERWECSARG